MRPGKLDMLPTFANNTNLFHQIAPNFWLLCVPMVKAFLSICSACWAVLYSLRPPIDRPPARRSARRSALLIAEGGVFFSGLRMVIKLNTQNHKQKKKSVE